VTDRETTLLVVGDPRDRTAIAGAVFGAARRAAMPWLPRLHSDAEDRRYFAEHVIGDCDVLVVRRERAGRPLSWR
jgi:hypothetical protein